MRRPFVTAVSAVCVGALAIVCACGNSAFSTGDVDASDADADGATQSDATVDGAVPSDGGISGSDGGKECTKTWCGCVPHAPTRLCDDFDTPGEHLGDGWDIDASFARDDGGVLTLSNTSSSSPPTSLSASVPDEMATRVEAALSEKLAALTTPVTVAFDLMIPVTGDNCAGANDFVRVNADFRVTRTGLAFASFGLRNNVPTVTIFHSPGETTATSATALPSGWFRVRFHVAAIASDGGPFPTLAADLTITDAGSDDSVDAGIAISAAAVLPTADSLSWVDVGLVGTSAVSSACHVSIDNVVIY